MTMSGQNTARQYINGSVCVGPDCEDGRVAVIPAEDLTAKPAMVKVITRQFLSLKRLFTLLIRSEY